jgi:hypothetical protein
MRRWILVHFRRATGCGVRCHSSVSRERKQATEAQLFQVELESIHDGGAQANRGTRHAIIDASTRVIDNVIIADEAFFADPFARQVVLDGRIACSHGTFRLEHRDVPAFALQLRDGELVGPGWKLLSADAVNRRFQRSLHTAPIRGARGGLSGAAGLDGGAAGPAGDGGEGGHAGLGGYGGDTESGSGGTGGAGGGFTVTAERPGVQVAGRGGNGGDGGDRGGTGGAGGAGGSINTA